MALTYPSSTTALSPLGAAPEKSGIAGVLEPRNRATVLAPLLGMFVTALANLVVLGPATTSVMQERKRRGAKEGKAHYEPGEQSPEMRRLNGRFSALHGASAVVNLVGAGVMVWYGALLAERIQ